MKPIKLIISALGPYADTMPEINFEQFEDRGLFLITGDTGSGKTMIFDSICFALYGTTSGTYRDTRNLRSEYAAESARSFVDFYFSHQGRQYRIWRQPTYTRRKQRGEGLVQEQEKAIFYAPGQPPVEGLKPVEQAIRELLRVDEKQFKQIAMIAQGEFWQLLNTKTEQRTEILRTIFMTGAYKNIESRLKDHMDASSNRRKRAEDSIIQYFGDVTAIGELQEELSTLQESIHTANRVWDIDRLLDIIQRAIALDRTALSACLVQQEQEEEKLNDLQRTLLTAKRDNELLERQEELQKKKDALEARRQEIQTLQSKLEEQKAVTREVYPAYRRWQTKKEEAEGTKKQIEDCQNRLSIAREDAKGKHSQLEEAEKKSGLADELQRVIDRIKEEAPKYQQRDILRKNLAELGQTEKTLVAQEKELAAREVQLQEYIRQQQELIAKLKEKPVELEGAKREGEEIARIIARMKEILITEKEKRVQRQRSLEQKQKEYQEARRAYDTVSGQCAHAQRTLEECRAGILATHLTEGEKCPVCGSMHHPEPAALPRESITEEDFKHLQEEESRLQEKKNRANVAAESAKTALDEYEESLSAQIEELFSSPMLLAAFEGENLDQLYHRLSLAADEMVKRQGENRERLECLTKECARLRKSEKDLEQAQGSYSQKLVEEKRRLIEQRQETGEKQAAGMAAMSSLDSLSFPTWEEAQAACLEAEKTVKTIRVALEQAKESRQKADELVTSLQATLQTLSTSWERQEEDKLKLLDEVKEKVSKYSFCNDSKAMLALVVTEDQIKRVEREITDYFQAVVTNDAGLQQASADAKGKVPVDISALQTSYMEQKEKVERSRKEVNVLQNRMELNEEKYERISERRAEFETAQKESATFKRLYEMVRGTTGNGKITLEQYIQATGFDAIIAAANRRLEPMSDGQYELQRREESLNRQSNQFLDLVVLDKNTGHLRPVGNLSGGESFKASLSLALGLSDTVAMNQGGIQMDALFIDEGFGTLDRRSIESTLETLIRLSNSNKLVGVISHRDEMRDNIPQQIRVVKSRSGSTFTVDLGN